MSGLVTITGVCRVCECTTERACVADDGSRCCWANEDRDLCSFCVYAVDEDGELREEAVR